MLKGKGLILKTDECAHAVRISLLEYSFFFTNSYCFRDTELLMFWSFFKYLQIYWNNEGYFTLFRYAVSFLSLFMSEGPEEKQNGTEQWENTG